MPGTHKKTKSGDSSKKRTSTSGASKSNKRSDKSKQKSKQS